MRKSMQFILPILQAHSHVGWPPGTPEEGEIITEALVLIERGDRAKHPIRTLESDRGVDLTDERFRRGIEEILERFTKGKIGIERDGQRLGILHLPRR